MNIKNTLLELDELLENDVMVYGTPPQVNERGFVKDTVYVTKDLVPKLKKFLSKALDRVAEETEKEMNIKAHHIWLYLVQLQKTNENNPQTSEEIVDEWNLLETIKEKVDEEFFISSLQKEKG